MSESTFMPLKDEKGNTICTCSCHVKGENVLHFSACCQYTYEEYLNTNGTIDKDAYNQIVDKLPR